MGDAGLLAANGAAEPEPRGSPRPAARVASPARVRTDETGLGSPSPARPRAVPRLALTLARAPTLALALALTLALILTLTLTLALTLTPALALTLTLPGASPYTTRRGGKERGKESLRRAGEGGERRVVAVGDEQVPG